MPFNIQHIRQHFPILQRRINGHPLVYLDNASTTQKPQCVLDALTRYYTASNANIHRGIHTLSEEATKQYEDARATVAKFINAAPEEIIFTRNTTESINLVAYAWGETNIKKDDTIMVSEMEHHSNLLPWHALAARKGAKLEVVPVTKEGTLTPSLSQRERVKGEGMIEGVFHNVKLLAITHMSNVLGTINPVQEIIQEAHKACAVVLVDAAQSAAHMPLDVKKLDCDFLAFSSHKLYGPTGVGVLYGKRELLEKMPPFLYGGDMVKAVVTRPGRVTSQRGLALSPIWNDLPWKFEAGTPHIAGAIGFAEALKFLEKVGWDDIRAYEQQLTEYTLNSLQGSTLYKVEPCPGITMYGPKEAQKRGPVISFTLEGIHPHDLASLLNDQGIAIRSGHHCAMPLHQALGVPATARASLAVYNTKEEIDRLIEGIKRAQKLLGSRG